MDDKTVGIIGGLGPEATVDLQQRVIRATPARDDADHIRMIVDNNPKIPSRIKALIEGTGASPVPVLQDMARRLEDYGADFLAMPCNTAHTYFEEIQSVISIPMLNMIELSVKKALAEHPGVQRVGVLASRAVITNALYTRAFGQHGVRCLYPAEKTQAGLMQAIGTVKAGRHGPAEREALRQAAEELIVQGAEVLLVACTELSLLTGGCNTSAPLVDTAQVLAEAIVRTAKA